MILILCAIISSSLLVRLAGSFGADPWLVGLLLTIPSLVACALSLPMVLCQWPRHQRTFPVVWPLVGLAAARLIATTQATAGPFTIPFLAASATAVVVALAANPHQDQIIPALQTAGLALAAVAAFQLVVAQNSLMNQNTIGMALLPAWCASLPQIRRRRLWPGLAIGLGLLLTISRGAILAAGLATVAFFGAWRWLPLPIALLPGLLILRNHGTIGIHWRLWSEAIRIWLDNPLLGIGPGHLPSGSFHGHNVLLSLLAWCGLAGLALVGIGAWLGIRRRPTWPRWAACSLLALGLAGLVDDWTVWPVCMGMAGCVFGAAGELAGAARRPQTSAHSYHSELPSTPRP